jgi:hypothetical protein
MMTTTTMTPSEKPRNLDYLAAKYAQKVISTTGSVKKASDVENAVTKVLGVLQENGVYACFVFAFSRAKEKSSDGKKEQKDEVKVMQAIIKQMLALLNEVHYNVPDGTAQLNSQNVLNDISENVTKELERLLLAKDVLEQMLIYARYGAKAREDNGE